MRDVLTILAGILIVALVALLAVPPLIDWPAHRALVDGAVARAIGAPARTEGALDIRLLPSPRIRIDRLRLGHPDGAGVAFDAMYLKAEIALTPLLAGEVRFLDTRIGRAEVKLPAGTAGQWRVPRRVATDILARRAWAFDDLSIQQFLVTTFDPFTGRTDQGYVEGVEAQAASLAGPFRLSGRAGGVPFEVATGEIGQDLSTTLKLGAGGGTVPRVDVDGRLDLVPGAADALVPRFAGTGTLTAGRVEKDPAAPTLRAQAALQAEGGTVDLAGLVVEAGRAGRTVRLTGTGRFDVVQPRLSVTLAGRRVDLTAWRDAAGPVSSGRPVFPVPVDLSLALDGLGIGGDEDLTEVRLAASLAGGKLAIASLAASGPGGATGRISGDLAVDDLVAGASGASGAGRISVTARDGERFGRFLATLGFGQAPSILAGGAFEGAADVTLASPVGSLRNLRLAFGNGTVVSGAARYGAPEAGKRARLDAQLLVQRLDVADLTAGSPLAILARTMDLALTVDARDVAYGSARGGRITGRIATDGTSIALDRLEVRDLAGARADLSGRIAQDGKGSIAGRLVAPRAAPLIDLFGPTWIGGLASLLPARLRDGDVDLAVTAERTESGSPAIRTKLEGRFGGGTLDAATLGQDGALREFSATASTPDASGWLGLPALQPRSPGRATLSGRRAGDGRLSVTADLDGAGLRLRTVRPLLLGGSDDRLDEGEVALSSDDASASLASLGVVATASVPVVLKASLSRRDALTLALAGRIAGTGLKADLAVPSADAVVGEVVVDRLSLPWLASALALNAPSGSSAALWSTARFGERRTPAFGGTLRVEAGSLDLGGGLAATGARFTVATRPDGFGLEGLDAEFAGGRLWGGGTLDRQGGLAALMGEVSLDGAATGRVLGGPLAAGRLGLTLQFGASGESAAALVANLGGSGDVSIEGFRAEAADPAAGERAAARVLRSDDPLATQRWGTILPDELAKGPLASPKVAAAGTLVGGTLRFTPIRIEAEGGSWLGAATVDLRTLTLDARGQLISATAPRTWTGALPAIGLGWAGPLAKPVRTLDPAPLVNGLAAVVLSRELDRIDTFDLDAAERQRRNSRTEMDRQRRQEAEEARQAKLREEAQERAREADRQRQEAAERRRQDRALDAPDGPRFPAGPLGIRPPAQTGAGG